MADFARRYLCERLVRGRVLALLAVLLLAASGGTPTVRQALLMVLLVVQFRMLDDHADRAHDAMAHPGRVTVTDPGAAWLRAGSLGLTLPVGLLLGLAGQTGSLIGYAALLAGALGLYRGGAAWPRFWFEQAVLLKYPLFVVLVATEPSWPWAILAWALVSLFELLTQPAWRAHAAGRALIAAHLAVVPLALLAASNA